MPLSSNQQRIYDYFQSQAEELERRAKADDGRLPAHQVWMHQYFRHPYLLLETDEYIIDRFCAVFNNSIDIAENGKISFLQNVGNRFLERLNSELQAETNMRQTWSGLSSETNKIKQYYQNGMPFGKGLFDNAGDVPRDVLVKFSREEFVKSMYEKGEIRLTPAKYYESEAPEAAMRDLETCRQYKVKALTEALDGQTEIEIDGHIVPIKNGFLEIVTPIYDYYMFCSCSYFSRRMPMDFKANAALLITDKQEFYNRFREATKNQYPELCFLEHNVKYYDPCNDFFVNEAQEFIKHFSYSYQREHRCIWKPRDATNDKLEPIFLELGSLQDISRPVYLS